MIPPCGETEDCHWKRRVPKCEETVGSGSTVLPEGGGDLSDTYGCSRYVEFIIVKSSSSKGGDTRIGRGRFLGGVFPARFQTGVEC